MTCSLITQQVFKKFKASSFERGISLSKCWISYPRLSRHKLKTMMYIIICLLLVWLKIIIISGVSIPLLPCKGVSNNAFQTSKGNHIHFLWLIVFWFLLLLLPRNHFVCIYLKPKLSNWYDHSNLLYLLVVYLILCISYVLGCVVFLKYVYAVCMHNINHSFEHIIH